MIEVFDRRNVGPALRRTRACDRRNEDGSAAIREDITLCENVQRGLRSSTYDRGRYSVKRENGVHHFHMLLSEFLGKEAPSNQRPEQAGA